MKAERGSASVPARESGPRQEGGDSLGPDLFPLSHYRTLHEPAYPSSTTRCRPRPPGAAAFRRYPRGSEGAIYARACIRTSENTYLPGNSVNKGKKKGRGC
jgi:hypothetical protein